MIASMVVSWMVERMEKDMVEYMVMSFSASVRFGLISFALQHSALRADGSQN